MVLVYFNLRFKSWDGFRLCAACSTIANTELLDARGAAAIHKYI